MASPFQEFVDSTLWPTGEHEVNAAKTARREIKWREIPPHEREAYRKAAETGWKVQTDNGAFEILPDAEAQKIRARLKASGQLNKILTPRYVFTDKNDGLRSGSNPCTPASSQCSGGHSGLSR